MSQLISAGRRNMKLYFIVYVLFFQIKLFLTVKNNILADFFLSYTLHMTTYNSD